MTMDYREKKALEAKLVLTMAALFGGAPLWRIAEHLVLQGWRPTAEADPAAVPQPGSGR